MHGDGRRILEEQYGMALGKEGDGKGLYSAAKREQEIKL